MINFFYKLKRRLKKRHLNTTWQAFKSEPWDFWCTENIMYYRLIELQEYFEKCEYLEDASKNRILKQIKLAIRLNSIFTERNENLYDILDLGNFSKPLEDRYVCNVNVNTRNAARFVHPDIISFYTKFPHELYILKARHLYYKILEYYAPTWAD